MATSAFGKAFRKAFDDGKTEFEFNGKKYNTKMKGDSAPASKAPSKTEAAAEEKAEAVTLKKPPRLLPKKLQSLILANKVAQVKKMNA